MAEEKEEQPQQPVGFDLNTWKGVFQNNKTKPQVALEWLWKNYEPENWSFWRIEYKYNNEIGQGFQASNGIKGTVQRWEPARKVGMGIFSVLKGGSSPWMQTGCLLLKGKEVPPEIQKEGNDDYVLYDWRKLDPVNSAEDKAIVESYFSFGDDVLHDGKSKLEHADGLKFL